jgi:hypothetical protein
MYWNKLTACSTTTSKRNISEEQQHCVVDEYRNGRGKHKSERKKREKVEGRILRGQATGNNDILIHQQPKKEGDTNSRGIG